MHELVLLLASIMSTDEIIKRLAESVDEYKEQKVLNKNLKEAEQRILVNCALLMAKHELISLKKTS